VGSSKIAAPPKAQADPPQNVNGEGGGEGGGSNLGDLLQEAYENGQLKGRQIIEAKRLIEKRQELGPSSPNAAQIKPPTSSYSLVRTYQKEVERQRKMELKAEHAYQRLLLVVQGLKKLFADENFVTLLRAEGLDTLPKYLAERITHFEGAAV
jgi:ParB family chromosome partitioning protein